MDGADQIANCQRQCFDYYACATSADCQQVDNDYLCAEGQCGECEISAFPGAAGSCTDSVGGLYAGPRFCRRREGGMGTPTCNSCASFAINDGNTTAAECELLETNFNDGADVVANCQRSCFGFYACATNADCPADRPLCDAGQCVVSSVPSTPTFSPLNGMGGGSSA